MKKLLLILATGFGTGFAPVASGTFGTMPAVLFVFWMRHLLPFYYLVITAAVFVIGIAAANFAEEYYNQKDSGKIVIDEIVGYFVTMFMVPVSLTSLIVGFFVFRFFDIAKIYPAGMIDRSDMRGLSVMLDDVAAGAYGCIVMQILRLFWLQ